MSTRRLKLAAAALVATLSLAACGGGGESPPPAIAPPAALDAAIWPDPAVATADDGPREVARSFIVDFLRMESPALGEFQQGDSRSGEVPVRQRNEDGSVRESRVLASVAVRQLDGPRWFVVAAGSPEVEIGTPEPLSAVSSPVTVAGTGRGFEANIVVRVHGAFDPEPLVEQGVAAGNTELAPFSAAIAFDAPRATGGAIVAIGGGVGAVSGTHPFAAVSVRFEG